MEPKKLQERYVFFTENKYYNNIINIPNEYEIPLFVKNRLKLHKERHIGGSNYISHELENYKKYHKTCERNVKHCAVKKNDNNECDKVKKCIASHAKESRSWELPPNRYSIKGNDMADIIYKQTGLKGPYACFSVPRTDATWPGHLAARKFKGSLTLFYNLPSEMSRLLHPREYFVMKIRKMPNKPTRPYLRCMLTDLTLCWRNPDEPGPGAYFPKNYCIGAGPVKRNVVKQTKPMFFYPRTTVPVLEHSYVRQSYNPGPERYRPDMIACPCRPGYTYDENIFHKLTLLKRKRFGYKSYLRLLNKCKLCGSGKMRNIPGHGHTSVFNSKTIRLVKKMESTKTNEKELKLMNSPDYYQMIQRPKRTIFSINFNYLIINRERKRIFFNTTQRNRRRVKLKANKHVAFLSAVPRFKQASGFTEVFLAARPQEIKSKRKDSKIPPEPEVKKRSFTKKTMQRLTKLPERYAADLKNRQPKEAVFNFQQLPQPNFASDPDELTVRSEEKLSLFGKELNIADFIDKKYLYGNVNEETSDFTNDVILTRSDTVQQDQSISTIK